MVGVCERGTKIWERRWANSMCEPGPGVGSMTPRTDRVQLGIKQGSAAAWNYDDTDKVIY